VVNGELRTLLDGLVAGGNRSSRICMLPIDLRPEVLTVKALVTSRVMSTHDQAPDSVAPALERWLQMLHHPCVHQSFTVSTSGLKSMATCKFVTRRFAPQQGHRSRF